MGATYVVWNPMTVLCDGRYVRMLRMRALRRSALSTTCTWSWIDLASTWLAPAKSRLSISMRAFCDCTCHSRDFFSSNGKELDDSVMDARSKNASAAWLRLCASLAWASMTRDSTTAGSTVLNSSRSSSPSLTASSNTSSASLLLPRSMRVRARAFRLATVTGLLSSSLSPRAPVPALPPSLPRHPRWVAPSTRERLGSEGMLAGAGAREGSLRGRLALRRGEVVSPSHQRQRSDARHRGPVSTQGSVGCTQAASAPCSTTPSRLKKNKKK